MTDDNVTCRSSKWVVRHAAAAYLILAVGVVLAIVLTNVRFDQANDYTNDRATEACEAGNQRSAVQVEDLKESARQIQTLDIEKLFGIDAEAAAEFRRLSAENTHRRILRIPFLNCETGERVPAHPAPVD